LQALIVWSVLADFVKNVFFLKMLVLRKISLALQHRLEGASRIWNDLLVKTNCNQVLNLLFIQDNLLEL
jgi:hypothetical protein